MALLLEEAQQLMAERDPAALLRRVCAAARPLTQASLVGVAIINADGAIDDFIAVGLDEAIVADLRQSMANYHDHPARAVFEAREIVRGVNPEATLRRLACQPRILPFTRTCSCLWLLRRGSMDGWRWWRRRAPRCSPTKTHRSRRPSARWPAWHTRTPASWRKRWRRSANLAGGVAHDFNNLLTAIMGYGGFALESAADQAQRRDLEEIVKAASRAAALTKQLLAFSRGHMVETAVLDLNLLIVDMVTLLRRMIGEDIELATTLAAGLSHVRADRSQLEQVVMNLVINARDACGPGRRIRLVTEAVDVDASLAALTPGLNRGAYVTLSVIDNGSGMNEATKSRLFEPFFTTKPRGQGTGLGLATVYGIVVRSGGAIRVESEFGRGSKFTVYLPREQEVIPLSGRVDRFVPPPRRTDRAARRGRAGGARTGSHHPRASGSSGH